MGRLIFEQHKDNERCYKVFNDSEEWLCSIEYRRTGTFMHWCQVMPRELMIGLIEHNQDVSFSPGCQDEIREFCRKLGGKRKSG